MPSRVGQLQQRLLHLLGARSSGTTSGGGRAGGAYDLLSGDFESQDARPVPGRLWLVLLLRVSVGFRNLVVFAAFLVRRLFYSRLSRATAECRFRAVLFLLFIVLIVKGAFQLTLGNLVIVVFNIGASVFIGPFLKK